MTMEILKYLRGGGGILGTIADNRQAEFDQTAMSLAIKQLANASTPQEKLAVMASYAGVGGDPARLRGPLSMLEPEAPSYDHIRGVGDGLYDLQMKKFLVEPSAKKRDFSNIRSANDGLFDLEAGKYVVPPKMATKQYNPPQGLGDDASGYIDQMMGVQVGKDGTYSGEGNPLDPELESKIRETAIEKFRAHGNQERALKEAYNEVVGEGAEFQEYGDALQDRDGLFTGDYRYARPKRGSGMGLPGNVPPPPPAPPLPGASMTTEGSARRLRWNAEKGRLE